MWKPLALALGTATAFAILGSCSDEPTVVNLTSPSDTVDGLAINQAAANLEANSVMEKVKVNAPSNMTQLKEGQRWVLFTFDVTNRAQVERDAAEVHCKLDGSDGITYEVAGITPLGATTNVSTRLGPGETFTDYQCAFRVPDEATDEGAALLLYPVNDAGVGRSVRVPLR